MGWGEPQGPPRREPTTTGGFALEHAQLEAPPVHIPDGNGGAYKTELVIERSEDRTEKILWWHADDPRAEPHNHPWDFVSTILHGGYTEDRYTVIDGGGMGLVVGHNVQTFGAGDVNNVPRRDAEGNEVFHNVRDVLPGTVTRMVCGTAVEGNKWSYLNIVSPGAKLIDPLTVYDDFRSLMWAINPHLRPAS